MAGPLTQECARPGANMSFNPWELAMAAANDSRADDFRALLEKRSYADARGAKLNYRLLKPQHGDANSRYPLVVFLHGAGERGDDNDSQLIHGVREFTRPEALLKHPCLLIAPQCPNGQCWVDVDWGGLAHTLPTRPSEPMRLTLELVKSIQKELPIDARRIYITGLSMGGYGVWDALARKPKLFAAAVPICGGADLSTASKIRDIPVWMFHGDQDDAVPVNRSRDMAAALKRAGGHPKYTEYSGVGHHSWEPAYKHLGLFAWLFEQRRND
jgi:predicted peptidase